MSRRITITNAELLAHACASLESGKQVKLRACGKSMRPFIREETDSLVIAPVTSLGRGDIVLARCNSGDYVVHRIISIKSDSIELAGDGNLHATETAAKDNVYGKVTGVVRGGIEIRLDTASERMAAVAWRALLPLRRAVCALWRITKRHRI